MAEQWEDPPAEPTEPAPRPSIPGLEHLDPSTAPFTDAQAAAAARALEGLFRDRISRVE